MNNTSHQNTLGQPIGTPISEWTERDRPPHTPMIGRFGHLERLDPATHERPLWDAFASASDERDWTYLPYGPFETFEAFQSWLHADCLAEDPLFHVIVDGANQQPSGLASYLRIAPKVGVIEVGHIHYSNQLQRTPLATEAMYLMLSRAFDDLGYRRYEWKCDAFNERSRRAALRLGFTFEGIFRQATIYKGRNRDTAWFSIVDTEWPGLRAAYQAWLSEDNFDERGQQRKRLSDFFPGR